MPASSNASRSAATQKPRAPLRGLDIRRFHEAEATEAETRARLGLLKGTAFDPAETPEARRAAGVPAPAGLRG